MNKNMDPRKIFAKQPAISRLERMPWWKEELDKCIEAHSDSRFEWGVFDCCIFTFEAVCAMTGFDAMKNYRGRYSSEFEAWQLVQNDLGMHIDRHFGPSHDLIHLTLAGDIAMFAGYTETNESHQGVGVIIEKGILTASRRGGLRALPLHFAKAAWRI